MNKSEPEYFIVNGDSASILWKTDMGKILVLENPLNINHDLVIYDMCNHKVDNVDLRNIIMDILPRKE